MQTARIMLALGGDRGNTVPKIATAAEIAVLRSIHGEDAVFDIRRTEDRPTDNRTERQRLRSIYGRAMDGNNNSILETLFPGAAARLYETLAELELPDEFFYVAPVDRAAAKAAVAAPEPVAPPPAPVVETAAEKRKRQAAEKAVKATQAPAAPPPAPEPVPAPQPDEDDDNDGIGDMPSVGGAFG